MFRRAVPITAAAAVVGPARRYFSVRDPTTEKEAKKDEAPEAKDQAKPQDPKKTDTAEAKPFEAAEARYGHGQDLEHQAQQEKKDSEAWHHDPRFNPAFAKEHKKDAKKDK